MQKTDTRQSILTLAQEFIQVRGYNAFSYQDISDRLKIQKASIHHHFHSKEELGAEVLEGARARFEDWSHSLAETLTPTQKLDLYLESVGSWAKQKDRICLGGIFSAEWNTLPPKMKKKAEEFQLSRREWLKKVLETGRKSGEFKTDKSVDEQALLIQASAQGALQVARVQEKPAHYETVMGMVKEVIKK
jgi:TetR/AcrR family transcriptional regulator, transcriptional repressor for nem operon